MSMAVEIEFTLNGRPVRIAVPAGMNVLAMLRDRLDLMGSKLSCGEGECGACTIIVDGKSVNSCLMFAVDCHEREVTTIEGLQDENGMDPLQSSFVEAGAIQCGYCTPGMIMQAKYLLSQDRDLSEADIKRGLEGNLCRCTGYRKIIDAIAGAAGAAGATGAAGAAGAASE
jgi:carbon-monoxide dehydrogenase small subunit